MEIIPFEPVEVRYSENEVTVVDEWGYYCTYCGEKLREIVKDDCYTCENAEANCYQIFVKNKIDPKGGDAYRSLAQP